MIGIKLKQKENVIVCVAILITTVLFFLIVRESGVQYVVDSQSYVKLGTLHGVRPIYPLFLFMHKLIFGEQQYLEYAIVTQSVLSVGCSLLFTIYIRKMFQLQGVGTYLCYVLSLLVYTIEWPNFISSQYILTEAITYPLFYLYVISIMQVIYRASWKDFVGCSAMTFILAMTRTQLMLLFGVTALAFAMAAIKTNVLGKIRTSKSILVGMVKVVVIIPLTLYLGIQSVNYGMSTYLSAYATITYRASQQKSNETQGVAESQDTSQEELQAEPVIQVTYDDNQSSHALWQRISYTIDEEDALLFEDLHMRSIFQELYGAIDEMEQRYPYRPKNLWTWSHIAHSTNENAKITTQVIDEYIEMHQGEADVPSGFVTIVDSMSNILLKEHWGDYIYYTLCLLPQSFVCTVFVQIESVYWLCYLLTLFLYVSAIVMSIICVKKEKCNAKVGIYMIAVITMSSCFVIATNLVLYGLQRYLYYIFGVFYVGYFLLLRELYGSFIRDRLLGVNRFLKSYGK